MLVRVCSWVWVNGLKCSCLYRVFSVLVWVGWWCSVLMLLVIGVLSVMWVMCWYSSVSLWCLCNCVV